MDKSKLEEIVKKVIMEVVQRPSASPKYTSKSGITSVRLNALKLDRFNTGREGDKVFIKDAITIQESPRLGCGLMEMNESVFDWTLRYDEIDYILEGTLEIITDDEKNIGNAGDIIYIPKNSAVKFSVPKYAKFLYVTYPANWAEQQFED